MNKLREKKRILSSKSLCYKTNFNFEVRKDVVKFKALL